MQAKNIACIFIFGSFSKGCSYEHTVDIDFVFTEASAYLNCSH